MIFMSFSFIFIRLFDALTSLIDHYPTFEF